MCILGLLQTAGNRTSRLVIPYSQAYGHNKITSLTPNDRNQFDELCTQELTSRCYLYNIQCQSQNVTSTLQRNNFCNLNKLKENVFSLIIGCLFLHEHKSSISMNHSQFQSSAFCSQTEGNKELIPSVVINSCDFMIILEKQILSIIGKDKV